jgi:hypothetical protein
VELRGREEELGWARAIVGIRRRRAVIRTQRALELANFVAGRQAVAISDKDRFGCTAAFSGSHVGGDAPFDELQDAHRRLLRAFRWVSRSSFEKPRPLERLRTASPSSTSTFPP